MRECDCTFLDWSTAVARAIGAAAEAEPVACILAPGTFVTAARHFTKDFGPFVQAGAFLLPWDGLIGTPADGKHVSGCARVLLGDSANEADVVTVLGRKGVIRVRMIHLEPQ